MCVVRGQLRCAACHSSLSCSFRWSLGAVRPRDGRGRAPCHRELSFATDRGALEARPTIHRYLHRSRREGENKSTNWELNSQVKLPICEGRKGGEGQEEGLWGLNCYLKVSYFFFLFRFSSRSGFVSLNSVYLHRVFFTLFDTPASSRWVHPNTSPCRNLSYHNYCHKDIFTLLASA